MNLDQSHPDYVPADPDYYVVTFIAGRPIGRIVHRAIETLPQAIEIKSKLDCDFGHSGRRALIQAVHGTRTYDCTPCSTQRKPNHAFTKEHSWHTYAGGFNEMTDKEVDRVRDSLDHKEATGRPRKPKLCPSK